MKKAAHPVLFLFLIFSLQTGTAQEKPWKETVENLQNAFRNVSRQVLPVVVEIDVVDIIVQDFPSFNPWQFFFGTPEEDFPFPSREDTQKREYRQSGLGSGVIVEQKGRTVYVITNYHVAGEAEEIRVTLNDGRTFDGNLAGADREKDLALIAFDTREEIPLARLGDSDSVEVGDWVLAVGNPYGFESTVTKGIVSANNRKNRQNPDNNTGYIQTDAAINSGNSGGALVNLDGEVIGINTWIATETGGNSGLGFSIPINQVKAGLDDLISLGRIDHPWLGVNVETADESLKRQMALEEWDGVFVYNTYAGSPARVGGILPGDLIIALNGQTIGTAEDLISLVEMIRPGDRTRITFVRRGRELTKTLRLASKSESAPWPGFSLAELTPEMRERMGLARNEGSLIVGSVKNGSMAAARGLRSGDVLKSIDGKIPRNMSEFYEFLDDSSSISLTVFRRGFEFTYQLKVE